MKKKPLELRRTLRSGLSVAIALSILLGVQLPAAAAIGQVARVPAGRPVTAPPDYADAAMRLAPVTAMSVSPLAVGFAAPSASPRLDVSAPVMLAAPAAAFAPAPVAAPADAPKDDKSVAPAQTPAREQDAGPRWVAPAGTPAPKGDSGPRWVAPKTPTAPSRLRAALARVLPFIGTGEAFDGATRRQELEDGAATSAKASAPRATGLSRHAHRHDIVQDVTIPTPEAVRRVAAQESGPRWVKYFAPVAIIGLTVGIFHASIVPVAIVSGALMLSVLAHESAHILGLRIWGDKTPALAGRDTINPLKHISLLGTVLVPAASLLASTAVIGFPLLFGWAKPVPVDFNNLKNPKTDAAKVAALGPLTNLALAAVAGLAYLAFPAAGVASVALLTLFKMNLALTAFNLLPLPFLDGGKILVSMLPKSWYAKWTHDPHLPMGYQRMYKAIYEGPAHLLSHLHVHSFDKVNGLTRLASLAALGAFYAAFFTVLQVPLMFLALPCSYDYWCIREKVRSEAAVKDLMDIMSQWSAVIVQIAEDKGLDSEVSAYETEHAMKNALETLIDELMAKEDFKVLSDADKIERLMAEYPDKAADFLKDKAMTEDSKEKILEVLADPRNGPYNERLRRWLKDHDIFKRWDNKHEQGKLKDTLKEADKKRSANGPGGAALGGFVGLIGLGAASAFFPDSIPHLAAWAAGFGFLGMLGSIASVGDGADAANGGPRLSPISSVNGLAANQLRLEFFAPVSEDEKLALLAVAGEVLSGEAAWTLSGGASGVTMTFADATATGRAAQRLRAADNVTRVNVSPEALSAVPSDWREKIAAGTAQDDAKIRVVFDAAPDAAALEAVLGSVAGRRERLSERAYQIPASSMDEATEMAREYAADARVSRVVVSHAVAARLDRRRRARGPGRRGPGRRGARPRGSPGARPRARARAAGQGGVARQRGVEHQPRHREVLRRNRRGPGPRRRGRAERRAARAGDDGEVALHFADLNAAVAHAKTLAARNDVATVKIHPNGTADLLEKPAPYPDALAYDHGRSLVVQFADGVSADDMRAYAEERRLRLVHLNFRGRDGMALFEVEQPADFARTYRMLALEDGARAMTVRPLHERAGLEAPERPAAAEPVAAAAEPAALPRRDPHQAWIEYCRT